MIKSILKSVLAPIRDYVFLVIGRFSPKTLAEIQYKRGFQKTINWDNPIDINEKINWLKFNSDTTTWSLLADKYRVREYVRSRGFGNMLVELYGKWDDVEDIDWNSLPDKFIMKTNNGSGDVLICKDKKQLDTKKATKHFKKLLNHSFGFSMAEPHYNRIKPCIIAEELLDAKKQVIKSSSLIDYKIWTFDGKPAYIWVCYDRTPHSVKVGLYDLDWNFHPEYSVSTEHYILSNVIIPKPESLSKMILAAAILSKGFPELRVDMYEVDGKPYFGELTFSSAAGFNDFYSEEFLNILGNLTHINVKGN